MTVLLMTFSAAATAQTTRVKGRVTDAGTGEGLPFAGVFFENTAIGVYTDMEGYYYMETRDTSVNILCAYLIGYETMSIAVGSGSFTQADFRLRQLEDRLDAAIIRPDNSYMRYILSKIDENRHRHDPERRKAYGCDVYTKLELGISNPEKLANDILLRKNFGFISDYIDTSVVSGIPYLPVMMSETLAKRYHSSPGTDREIIEANRMSGLNPENALQQFTGSLHMKVNFYDNYITSFNVDIPSPLSSHGELFYNYYLIDSLQTDGRKTYRIRYHPKRFISTPAFDGEMSVDAEEFALKEMHAKLMKGANVNWIRDLAIDVRNVRLESGEWFYLENRMYADFSVTSQDIPELMSFVGRREQYFSSPEFDVRHLHDSASGADHVTVRKDAGRKSDEYWDRSRPFGLSDKEKGIYDMVYSVQNAPAYRNFYTVFNMLATGYLEGRYLGFGPVMETVSFNNLEGLRIRMGVRTTKNFSRKYRLLLYGAYGTEDRHLKGGGRLEYMFGTDPTRKLTVTAKHELVQLGRSETAAFHESNIFSSVLTKAGTFKKSPVNQFSVKYDHEWSAGFNNVISLETMRIFANRYIPMIRPDGSITPSIAYHQLHYSARFSREEAVTRGVFDKSYIYTKYPVVRFDIYGAVKGLARNDYGFLRTEMTVNYRLATPPLGFSNFTFNAGHIHGTVPYPLLKLHEGNNSYFFDRNAFACMDYYEFASDTWATLFYEHNFNGFFLGKIPLLKLLHCREVFTLKAAYGTISDRNNGIAGTPQSLNAPMLFPENMSDLRTPYIETGVGISNILSIIRVDAFWRLTHRYTEIEGVRVKNDCFALNFGLELLF